MAIEFAEAEQVPPVQESTPEQRRAAALAVCRAALTQDDPHTDAAQLLDMLGLRGERKSGCRNCGGPMPLWAIGPKTGMHGNCSTECKRAFLGEGAR